MANFDANRPSTPAYTMPGRQTSKEKPEIPGPGAYETIPVEKLQGVTISQKFKVKNQLEDIPGPGTYDVTQSRPDTPSYTLGARRYIPDPRSEVPGPGTYSSPGKKNSFWNQIEDLGTRNPAHTMGARNPHIKEKMNNPGPGTYVSIELIRPSTPSYSFSGRPVATSPQEEVPGPGAYVPTDGKTSLAFSLSSKVEIHN